MATDINQTLGRIKVTAGVLPIIIGVVTIVVASICKLIVQSVSQSEQAAAKSFFAEFVMDTANDFIISGFVIVAVGLFSITMVSSLSKLWDEKISPELFGKISQTSRETREIVSINTLMEIIESPDIPQSTFIEVLPHMHAKAFGDHCGHESGLYSFVAKKMVDFYKPETPHRSDYHQTVNVRIGDAGNIIWQEVCTYKIHAVSLDPKYGSHLVETSIPYTLKFKSTLKSNELSLGGEEAKYQLKIAMYQEGIETIIFQASEHLMMADDGKISPKSGFDFVKVLHQGEKLEIEVEKRIDLVSAWTELRIQETSHILDDYFISRRNEPTCGAKITVSLPDDWSFELISFGHPKDWTIH